MSFNNLPNVDRYAQNEAESRNALKYYLQEKNGFLTSSDDRDMGSDFLFELILEQGATNWRFPVQLKSIETPEIIQNGQYISYAFQLSTLRYLLQFTPPVAIIVFYLLEDRQLYYDYAENIYYRLMEVNDGSNAWKEQEKAKIHIPTINILNEKSCEIIHSEILDRYRNMQGKSEALYPPLDGRSREFTSKKLSTSAPIKDAVTILINEGLQLYYTYDIRYLNALLNTLPNKTISGDPHLSLLAGITFHDMKMLVDAGYFLEKALLNKAISEEDRRHAQWTKTFNDLQMGKINKQQVEKQIDEFAKDTQSTDELNLIHYELCIARNRIEELNTLEEQKFVPFIIQFEQIIIRLNNINQTALAKSHFHLLNAINLSLLINKLHSFTVKRVSILEKHHLAFSQELRDEARNYIDTLVKKFGDSINEIISIAEAAGSNIQIARAHEVFVAFRVITEVLYLRVNMKREGLGGIVHSQQISQDIHLAQLAFQRFFDGEYYGSACNCLFMFLELREIARYYDIVITATIENMEKHLDFFQKTLNIEPPVLQSQLFINRNRKQNNGG